MIYSPETLQAIYDRLPAKNLLAEEQRVQQEIQELQERSSMIAKAILNRGFDSENTNNR